ncbi:unnamed protein product [Closterium sp. NIES-54]
MAIVSAPRLVACLLILAVGFSHVAGIRFEVTAYSKCLGEEVQEGTLVVATYQVVPSSESSPLTKITAKVTSPFGRQLHWQSDVEEGHFGFTAKESGQFMACFWMPHGTPGKDSLMVQQRGVEEGHFGHTAKESGQFMACFWMSHGSPGKDSLMHGEEEGTLGSQPRSWGSSWHASGCRMALLAKIPSWYACTLECNVDLEWRSGVAAKDWESIAKKEKIDGMGLELRKLDETVRAIRDEMTYFRGRESAIRDSNERTNERVAFISITSLLICVALASIQLWFLLSYFHRKKLL